MSALRRLHVTEHPSQSVLETSTHFRLTGGSFLVFTIFVCSGNLKIDGTALSLSLTESTYF